MIEKHNKSQVSDIKSLSSETSRFTGSSSLSTSHKSVSLPDSNIDQEVSFPFTVAQEDVIDLFHEIVQQKKFQMIQREQNYATAIKKGKKGNFWEMINCLNWWGSKNALSAVKVVILENKKNEIQVPKICKIKSLSVTTPETLDLIQSFKDQFQARYGVCSSSNFDIGLYKEHIPQGNNLNPFHLEACSYFLFHKIIAGGLSEEKKIAKSLESALQDFHQSFKNVKESSSSLPTPSTNAIGISRQVFENIRIMILAKAEDENYEILLPFIKIAAEKYVFDKTQILLKQIYNEANCEIEQKYKEKCGIILNSMSVTQIFEEVLLNKNLRICNGGGKKPCVDRNQIEFCCRACPHLEKLTQTSSPRQKIKICQLMYAELKSYFFQKLKRKYQLSSMQDIIPVFIIIILFTKAENLKSQLDMMSHFIQSANEDFEAEKRLIVNLSESYNYIVRDWKV